MLQHRPKSAGLKKNPTNSPTKRSQNTFATLRETDKQKLAGLIQELLKINKERAEIAAQLEISQESQKRKDQILDQLRQESTEKQIQIDLMQQKILDTDFSERRGLSPSRQTPTQLISISPPRMVVRSGPEEPIKDPCF
ncbi:MAG: hypothetical protein EZS28_032697 [Streblomastix strix]|uniref:Uncharacterized protein n=1 Tax=Streblomastix strix TaxID=222440 RepID=A0A5J4UMA0_9EUKA|nr:MAG: hypothetical protein EZS28_032697 [Streblomastix strix]